MTSYNILTTSVDENIRITELNFESLGKAEK